MASVKLRNFDATGSIYVIITLLFFSTGAIFIRYFTGYFDSWTQNFYRYAVGACFWLPFLLLSLRKKQWDHSIWWRAIGPTMANVFMQSFSARAIYYIEPAFAMLLFQSSILWIVTFSLIFFAEERGLIRSKFFWMGLVMCLSGLMGVLAFKEGFAEAATLKGIVLTLIAGIGSACYVIAIRVSVQKIDSRQSFAVIALYTAVGLAVLAMLFGEPAAAYGLKAGILGLVVMSGIIPIALAHVIFYASIKRIGTTIPSLVLLLTPFSVLALSNAIFGEKLSLGQWFSGLVLIVGAGLALWAQKSLRRE